VSGGAAALPPRNTRGAARQRPIPLAIGAALACTLALSPPSHAALATVGMPDAAQTLEAYHEVSAWVRAWDAPTEPAFVDPEGAHSASVTLRLSGVIVGRGTEVVTDGSAVWRAARGAMLQATERAPVARDALRDEALRDTAQRMTIDVQIGGAMIPLAGATFSDAANQVSHGVEGVAARVGQRVRAYFPGALLSANTSSAQGLIAACADLDLPPLGLDTLRADHGVILYRFPVQHLAQTEPGEEPVFLFRGGRVLSHAAVSERTLRDASRAIVRHLMSRELRRDDVHVMMGDYQPWLDSYDPLVASPVQRALTAYALFRHASGGWVDRADGVRAARFAWTQLDLIAAHDKASLRDPVVASAFIAAAAHAGARPPGLRDRDERDDDALRAAALRTLDAYDPDAGWDNAIPDAARALVAYALSVGAGVIPDDLSPPDETRALARSATRALFRETPPGMLVAMSPWLGWAELALLDEGAPVPAATALREMRELVWRHQITVADAGDDAPDFLGGVVFTASRSMLPNWQAARPVALLATMLADPRLTDADETGAELARLSRSLRFLLQLTVDDALMHMFRDRDRAIGGVRASPWDQRLQIDANVATLLAIDETLRATAALRETRP